MRLAHGAIAAGLCLVLAPRARAGDASAAPPPPPAVSMTVSDDAGDVAYRPHWSLFGGQWTLTPVLKAGALALTESFPYAYPILKRSPFAEAGATLAYHGAVDVMASATVGYVDLRSRRLIDDPQRQLGSLASDHPGRELSVGEIAESYYVDVGKTFTAGAGWKGAVYAAFDQFAVMAARPTPGNFDTDGLSEASVGTTWLKRAGNRELSFWGSVSAEAAPRDFYRNDSGNAWAPSQRAGLEYALVRPGGQRWFVGTELQNRRADDGLRGYAGLKSDALTAMIGAEWRKSRSDFYPDSGALVGSVNYRLSRNLTAGVSARVLSSRYRLAPSSGGGAGPFAGFAGSDDDSRVMATMSWTLGARAVVQAAKTWGQSRLPEYVPQSELALNADVTGAQRADIRAIIAASPTLGDFLQKYRAESSLDVLAALSEFTSLFSRWNYNDNEGHPENLDQLDQIYIAARQSYLTSTADPTLVCLGAAQYAAAAAQLIGRHSGIEIMATATTVRVPDSAGNGVGHAVAAVKTKDYGIVFVDWGRLIPTYTFNTERALRLYQALVGTPSMFHEITDASRNGRHVGYLFTEEGKLLVSKLTFHDELARPAAADLFRDDPRGDQTAEQRYRDLISR